jgi:DNA repair protein RadC
MSMLLELRTLQSFFMEEKTMNTKSTGQYTLADLLGMILRESPGSDVVKGVESVIASDRHIMELTKEELLEIGGIGETHADSIVAALLLTKIYGQAGALEQKISFGSPKEVADLMMEEMRYLDREHFKILLLNTKNSVICVETISIGSLNASIVHPREVFKSAIKKSAASVILLHNHPSGNPEPSAQDIDVTHRLVEAGKILGIQVLDHIVFGDGIYVSMKEESLL